MFYEWNLVVKKILKRTEILLLFESLHYYTCYELIENIIILNNTFQVLKKNKLKLNITCFNKNLLKD